MHTTFIISASLLCSMSLLASREDYRSTEGLTVKSSQGFWIAPGESTDLQAVSGNQSVAVTWEELKDGQWEKFEEGPNAQLQADYEQGNCRTTERKVRAAIMNRPGPQPLEFVIRVQEPRCTLTTKDGLAHNAATKVIIGRSGTVIAGTENGLTMFQWPELRAATFREAGDKRPLQVVSALEQRENGELWIGAARSFFGPFPIRGFGLEVFDTRKHDPWKKESLLSKSYVSSISFGTTKNGDTFPIVLTTNNYAHFGGSRGGLYVRNLSQNQMPDSSLYAILPLEAGLWLVAGDQGLDIFEGGSLDRISSPEWTGVGNVSGIGSRQLARALAMDHDQNIWVGLKGDRRESLLRITNAQMIVISSKKYKTARNRHVGQAIPLPEKVGKEVRALVVDDENNLWVATNSGLVKRAPSGSYLVFRDSDGLGSSDVRDLFYDAKMQFLWIATKSGLTRFSLKQL